MRALIVDKSAKAAVREVVSYAEKPENWYLCGPGGKVAPGSIPGDNPRHCLTWNTYECVFSFTKTMKGVYRHLSISVPSKSYPNPYAAFMIATEFGLTGWDGHSPHPPSDWIMDVNQQEHCVVLAQRIALTS